MAAGGPIPASVVQEQVADAAYTTLLAILTCAAGCAPCWTRAGTMRRCRPGWFWICRWSSCCTALAFRTFAGLTSPADRRRLRECGRGTRRAAAGPAGRWCFAPRCGVAGAVPQRGVSHARDASALTDFSVHAMWVAPGSGCPRTHRRPSSCGRTASSTPSAGWTTCRSFCTPATCWSRTPAG